MRIYIHYNNKKTKVETYNYQSIGSIINKYLEENRIINNEINNYFLDYNGLYLNNNYSLEKYDIVDDFILNLNNKLKGGSSTNIILWIITIIIVIIPFFTLPLGFTPLTATLIKNIIDQSLEGIGHFLICNYGKKTLYNRIKIVLIFIKYVIFILMIYVVIAFPILLLCIMLKGHSIFDNPKEMCGAINAGNTAGLVLTAFFIFVYVSFRFGNIILESMISFFNKIIVLNWIFVPLLKGILSFYNKFKYYIVTIIPYAGTSVLLYHFYLDLIMPSFEIFLGSIINVGCKPFKINTFMKSVKSEYKNFVKENKLNDENHDNGENILKNYVYKNNIFKTDDPICNEERLECCKPENFILIANELTKILENPVSSGLIKGMGLYPAYILFTEALYEGAISNNQNINIEEINEKIDYLENLMIENDPKYKKGKTFFKVIFRNIFLNIFCNISNTAKSTKDIISKTGEMGEVIEMIKAGSATGAIMTLVYFISVIIIIICGIFKVF